MKKAAEPKSSPVIGHPHHSVRRQVIVSLLVAFFLLGATVLIILYGKGFRFSDQQGNIKLSKTGILSVNSTPKDAAVYINDHMTTTATNNSSVNLAPGRYHIKITKEGYSDWLKDFDIKTEQVSYAEATLFPQAPSLQSISTFGIQSTMIDPTGTKLAFNLASGSAKKNGIYVYDMTSRNFPILAGQSNTTQIVDDSVDKFSGAKLAWSPDGKQIVASISAEGSLPTYYLLNATQLNPTPQDITAVYSNTIDLWKQQRNDKKTAQLKSLPKPVQKFAKQNWNILSWSPDDNEILYQASQSAQTPVFRNPRLIGDNNLYEQRHIEDGGIYVYNIKEDFNTRLVEKEEKVCTLYDPTCNCDEFAKCPIPYTWMPDSNHLLYVHDKTIYLIEDDGSNKTTIYAGPFVDHYVFPWPDGSKVVILTNFNNSTVPPTLYSISLK